jgi:RimJ/RimL family protein N-acetyltransferase
MIFNQKEIILKDGRRCILRSPKIENSVDMLEFLKVISSETHFLLMTPQEVVNSVEKENEFINSINNSDSRMMITSFIDGEIAGNCQVSIHTKNKTRHRCDVAIALKSKFWNLGLGTALFAEMITHAKNNNCTQMELEYIEGNQRAKALYEKMGFNTYAERKKSIKLNDGIYLSEFLMLKEL